MQLFLLCYFALEALAILASLDSVSSNEGDYHQSLPEISLLCHDLESFSRQEAKVIMGLTSLRDHYPEMPDIQCLKIVILYNCPSDLLLVSAEGYSNPCYFSLPADKV